MDGPLLRDGAIAFACGEILSVGTLGQIEAQFPSFPVRDLGQAVLMPGLINAHTHMELSDSCSGGEKWAGKFTDWILRLPQRARMDTEVVKNSVACATQIGIDQSLRFGVTCVGDITQYPQFSRPVLANSPLRAISYAEALGVGKRRRRFEQLLAYGEENRSDNAHIQFGISPHAPYSVDLPGYEQCLALSRQRQMPLATHLAEWPDETDYLVRHAGMFREFMDLLGFWQEDIKTHSASPIRFADAIGVLDEPAVLAHVNYCDDEELNLLAAGQASVIYCPRTHRYFGHPPHRWREMLDAGINVAIGTDSCASSPDLNLVDEIRLLHKIAPEVESADLWRLITVNAAKALGQNHLGRLAPRKAADFVAFPTTSDDPLTEILENKQLPIVTWIAGNLIPR